MTELSEGAGWLRCDLSLEETASHVFYYCLQMLSFWDHFDELTAHVGLEHHVFIDPAYVCNNDSASYSGINRMVYLTLIAETRIVIWRLFT